MTKDFLFVASGGMGKTSHINLFLTRVWRLNTMFLAVVSSNIRESAHFCFKLPLKSTNMETPTCNVGWEMRKQIILEIVSMCLESMCNGSQNSHWSVRLNVVRT